MASEKLIDTARANYPLVEELYEKYKKDSKSVSEDWIEVFKTLELIPASEKVIFPVSSSVKGDLELKIHNLINAYRKFGYLAASLNPLSNHPVEEPPQLKLENFGFNSNDLSQEFPTCGLMQTAKASLAEIVSNLKKIYSGRIGFEYKDRGNVQLEKWLEKRIESTGLKLDLRMDQKQMIFQQLNKSELFESFLHTRFPGQKRFSLEGAETLIPMLSEIIEKGGIFGADEFILGMTHRGRLNVLANILNKSYADVFSEFEEGYFPDSFEGSGDVKYHKGFLSDVLTLRGHEIKISLTPNPSHLESVDPVVEGQVKGRQIKRNDVSQDKVIPILTHGDAALSGQGVVYETLQLSRLKGYSTGGTLHIVINNQIGFTTVPEDARSTRYCTDIAQSFSSPVFHVNTEDPEACVFAAEIAMEVRHLFHCDVFIELICYRKYGHNESDEPAFTQPHEYKLIRSKKSIREVYRDQLIKEGVVEKFMAEAVEVEFKKALQDAGRAVIPVNSKERDVSYKRPMDFFSPIITKAKKEILQKCGENFCSLPKDLKVHPKLKQLFQERLKMIFDSQKKIDWGMGEILAFASLLWEGVPVRLSGQDSGRGTFSHRHALLVDQEIEQTYYPLSNLREGQGRADIINSPLSEYAVLGFEYGYSIAYPETLVIWEAQFGDFGNAAQVVIDQYIASAEVKWGQKSSLILLLPHGYEGQGPEHSSARIERFLTLSADDNMYICNPSTPAQYFHLLRRQSFMKNKRPLICMTPKSLLRNPLCVSLFEDFEKGCFEEILDDPRHPYETSKQIVFCSGKLFYELEQYREKEKIECIAFIRLEQLYPLHKEKILSILKKYKQANTFIWAQEEPANMGAWSKIRYELEALLPNKSILEYAGRPESAASATGSYVLHKKELAALFKAVMTKKKSSSIEITHFHRA